MERKDVSYLLERIQANRQSFLITNAVLDEWSKVLEPYDYFDLNKKLDEYFRDGENFGKYPDVYYLIKYLKTNEEKKIENVPYVICQNCRDKVKYEDYKSHYDRCSSVCYLIEMSKRYLNKELNKQKLFAADFKSFDKYYYSTCKLIYNQMPEGFPKHLLENVLLSYEGKKINYGLEKLKGEIYEVN